MSVNRISQCSIRISFLKNILTHGTKMIINRCLIGLAIAEFIIFLVILGIVGKNYRAHLRCPCPSLYSCSSQQPERWALILHFTVANITASRPAPAQGAQLVSGPALPLRLLCLGPSPTLSLPGSPSFPSLFFVCVSKNFSD